MVQPHELKVGELLARSSGFDVTFLAVGIGKSPDILFRGKKWEIKSPKGSKSRTIENNVRNALKQSNNVIIDLGRIQRSDELCLRDINKQIFHRKSLRNVLVVTKLGKVVLLK